MEITKKLLKKIYANDLTLDEYFILYVIKLKLNWLDDFEVDLENLILKGFIEEGKLTAKSEKLFKTYNVSKNKSIQINFVEAFQQWWSIYPSSDQFKHFKKTRGIKSVKCNIEAPLTKKCFHLYCNIIIEACGDLTPDDLNKALENQIEALKRTSTDFSRLKFMPSPYTYLYQRIHEQWLDKESIETETSYGKEIE